MSTRFYITPTADSVPFDNDTNGFAADTVQAAIEESKSSAVGNLLEFPFVSSGNTANKWLGYSNSAAPSDSIPLIIPQGSTLKGLTFSNRDSNVDIDIEVYRNGTLVYTWEVRNKRVAWDVGISGPSFLQGDRVSCFMRKFTLGSGDQTAQDPIVEFLIKVTSEAAATGGIQNGL